MNLEKYLVKRWGNLNRGGVIAFLINNWTIGGRYSFASECWVWSFGPIVWKVWKR